MLNTNVKFTIITGRGNLSVFCRWAKVASFLLCVVVIELIGVGSIKGFDSMEELGLVEVIRSMER